MATAGDGRAPYESSGAGGKFRKKPFRRSVQATPYDRHPTPLRNTNPGLFTKLVDPASRLIYAGAHRLFGAFRKRLPPLLSQGPPEINEEARNVAQEAVRNNWTGVSEPSADQGVYSASISAAAGISELEQMLKQKTFTRSEIQRLTALLHSKTTESPSADVERDGAKLPSSPSHLLRHEASTSGSLKKYGNERDNFHADNSTPVVTSSVLEEEIASPAELAKAYMGSRPMKVAPSPLGLSSQTPRHDVKLLNNASGLPKTPIASVAPKTANSFRGLENGFLTPRSRGRSAMYSMARTPYSRGPSTFSQKEINSDYGHGAVALTSSQSTWRHEGKMAIKRRSSVLDDDIGSGGPLRRTRQKPNLLSHGNSLSRDKSELGYTAVQQPDASSQKLLLMNKPEPKVFKDFEENGETSLRGSGYGSVPTKSTQMATKILQQLERLSPKEKKSTLSGMRDKSPSKLTLNMLHGQALRSLEKVDSPKFLPSPHDGQKSEGQHHDRLHDIHEPASQSKDKVEENSSKKFPIPRNMLTPVNGDSTVSLKDKAPVVITTASTSKLPAELPQKKRAFQMSAHEDSLELDDDIYVNGHVSFPSADDNNKPEASLVANKPVFAEDIQTPTLPDVSKTSALAEVTPVLPEVVEIPEQADLKEAENVTSPKTAAGFLGGSVSEQGMGFKFATSPPSTITTQTGILPQSTLQMEKVAPEKDSNNFSLFGSSAEKASPFQFSANQPSEIKPNVGSDPKALDSTSVFNSVSKNDHVKFPAFNKDENGDSQKTTNMFGKSESLSSPALATTSTSGIFSFGSPSKNSSTPNATPVSTPPMFSSSTPFPASAANSNSFFNNSSSNVTSASTVTITSTTTATLATTTVFSTSLPAPAFSTSLPAPVFSFGSAIAPNSASTAPTPVAETGNINATNGKEPKSNMSSSPFASTSFATTTTGSSLFGFSSPAATSTTNTQSQASFFNATSGSQATTQTSTSVTQAVPFMFGSSTPSLASGSTSSSLFGSSASSFSSTPSFGISSVAAASETKSGSSTSGSTTSVFGSAATWQPPKSSGFGSMFSSQSSVFSFGASSTPMPSATTSPTMFGSSNTGASTGSSMFSFATTAGATNSSFAAPSQGQSVFGNSTPVFGAAPTTSPNNNDQMSMEDSMAEDSMQTPSPVSQFGQAPAAGPGFMFGSANPTPTPTPTPTPAAVPFQFGGQPNQAPTQNPFQSSSVEFNGGGGSFSLGSGGDKSGRRIVRVKTKNRRNRGS